MSQSEEASVSWLGAEEAADAQSDRRLGLLEPLVANLRGGRLRIVLPNGRAIVSPADRGGLQGTLVIERWRALRRLALGGDVGFAEAYVDGDWTSPDPVALLRIAAHNFEPLREATQGSALFRWADRLRHLARGNTRRGSRRNIMAHYDLGNDFYELWLDPTMQYSSALWTEDTPDLEAAQALKLNRVVELLDLSGGESVLEIGCGWGSLATRLAETEGAGVTAITLSPAQLAFARARATSRGCDRRVDFRLLDYRDVSGRFDRVVSIEMLEAVGEARWPRYFQTVAKSLKAGGRAVLQTNIIGATRISSRSTSFPAASCRRRRRSRRRSSRRDCGWSSAKASDRPTRERSPNGVRASFHAGRRRPPSASTIDSAVCGTITSPIARP